MLAPHARSAPAAKATYAPLGAALRTNPDTNREGTFHGQSVLATAVRDQQQRQLEPAATPSAVLLRKVEPELPPPPPPPPPVTTLAPRPTVQPATGPPAATDGAAAVHVPRDGGASNHTNNAPLRHTRDAPPRRCWPLFSISVGCSFGRVRVVASVGSAGPLARPSSSRWSPPLPVLPAVSHAAAPPDAFALARAACYTAAAAVEQAPTPASPTPASPTPASPTSASPTSVLLPAYSSAASLRAAIAAANAAVAAAKASTRDRAAAAAAAAARDRAAAATAATARDRERRSAALHALRAAAEASPNGSPSRASWLDLCAAMDEAARRAAAAASCQPPGGATNVRAAAVPGASFHDGWSGPQALAGVSWHPLRACTLVPALAPAGYSPLDVSQRNVGDCYLLSSFASLAAVAPEAVDASFITGVLNDAGLLGVRFWVGEAWQWVWLDETLPCQPNVHICLSADNRGMMGGEPNPASGKHGYPWGVSVGRLLGGARGRVALHPGEGVGAPARLVRDHRRQQWAPARVRRF